ncbi:MAG TPA: phage major capsid protein [Rubrivivax sp.]|nr:phage major capsid protein [Rubrivivax sp.]
MHRTDDFLPERGLQLARLAICKAKGMDALDFAERHYGARSSVVQMLKADVSGGELGDAGYPTVIADAGAEFAEPVDTLTLLRSGLTAVPAGVPYAGAVTDPGAAWVGGGKAIPVSNGALDRATLFPKKVASLVVLSNEWLESSDARMEQMILRMMQRAARKAIDLAIADPSNSGDADTPASITSGATPISSSGDLAADVEAALAAYQGSISTACWWMSSALGAQAGLRAGAFGAGANLGALGGTLAGLPAFCSDAIRSDTSGSPLILVDRASVALVDAGYQVRRAQSATIEMSDAPTGSSIAPVGAGTGTKVVNMFQVDATAILVIRRVNWHLGNPGAVVVIEGADYATAT